MQKDIFFSNHSKIKMIDRGATEEEVIKSIYEGSFKLPVKGGNYTGKTLFLIENGMENIIL